VKKAANSLVRKVVEWDDKEGKTWYCTALIYNVKLTKGSGIMKFDVSDWVWDMMLDFSKGFRKYELVTAMKFKSPYTMRFYELMSGQQRPLYLSLKELREMFGVQDKYKRPAMIRARIIDPAKKELDETSPYSFFPKEERDGDKKTSKITGYTFFPVFHEHNQDKKLQKAEQQSKVTARFQLDDQIYDYLHHSFGFQSQEINKNKTTFIEGQNCIPDFMGFLCELKAASRFADNPKGYVINAIKIKTKESAIQKE
jgi:plasmid replication initiation protein